MKRLILLSLLLFATINVGGSLSARRAVEPNNPILRVDDEDFLYVADPAAEVYNGRVYLYCSHDQPYAKGYSSMQDYVVLESKDLKNWINHGVVIKPREYSWAHGQMNAPDAAYKDGWYYLYFPYNKIEVGVAKSRNPEGPWVEAVTDKITTIFDPTVFVDDDGQAYIYGNHHPDYPSDGKKGWPIMGAKLKDNMTELDGDWFPLSDVGVNEGVHIFKREGKYYFTARKGDRTSYHMADEPLPAEGGAKFMGYITPHQGDAPAHNSVIEFKGNWYIFYQRGDVNRGTGSRRSSCFEELKFNDDGTIVPVEYTVDEAYLNVNL